MSINIERARGWAFPDEENLGLTKRDYFAAAAMSALIGRVPFDESCEFDVMAQFAYQMADYMLEAREEK